MKNAPRKTAAKKAAPRNAAAAAETAAPQAAPQQPPSIAGLALFLAGQLAPPAPKVAFEVSYDIRMQGHVTERRHAVIAATRMSEVVNYIEGKGGVVQSCDSVNNGAEFIEL